MGFLGLDSLLALQSGNKGSAGLNYQADNASLIQPTDATQIGQTFDKTQQGLDSQKAFVDAYAAQNPLNQQIAALQAQQALQAQATAQGGLANQSSVFNQQQALANQLQGVANGTGPNPAAASLANATAANTANQAALMAGQRGASANAGLIARQAAQQGAANQQNAIGQSAVLQANQQLAGMNALANQQAALGNTAGAQVGNAYNANNAVSNTTGQLVGQQAAALQGYNQAAQSEYATVGGLNQGYNNANVAQVGNTNNANASIANVSAQGQQKLTGGLLNQAGGAAAMLAAAHGGMVPSQPKKYAEGGPVSAAGRYLYGSAPSLNDNGGPSAQLMSLTPPDLGGPSAIGDIGKGMKMPAKAPSVPSSDNLQMPEMGSQFQGTSPNLGMPALDGSAAASAGPSLGIGSLAEAAPMAAAYQSGGPVMLASEGAGLSMSKGGNTPKKPINGEMLAAKGKEVPGKAKVKGNSYENDTVDAKLSPGEVVIPRSVMQSSDPINNAAKFVASVLAKKGRRLG